MAVVCACRYPVCLSSCCRKRRFHLTLCLHPWKAVDSLDPLSVCTQAPQHEWKMPPTIDVRVPNPVLATSEQTSYCLRLLNCCVKPVCTGRYTFWSTIEIWWEWCLISVDPQGMEKGMWANRKSFGRQPILNVWTVFQIRNAYLCWGPGCFCGILSHLIIQERWRQLRDTNDLSQRSLYQLYQGVTT